MSLSVDLVLEINHQFLEVLQDSAPLACWARYDLFWCFFSGERVNKNNTLPV